MQEQILPSSVCLGKGPFFQYFFGAELVEAPLQGTNLLRGLFRPAVPLVESIEVLLSRTPMNLKGQGFRVAEPLRHEEEVRGKRPDEMENSLLSQLIN